jgi:transposase
MSLLQFCKTERQREVVSRVEEGKSQRDIAAELGLGRGTVRGHLEAVRAVAAKQGYSPSMTTRTQYLTALQSGVSRRTTTTRASL